MERAEQGPGNLFCSTALAASVLLVNMDTLRITDRLATLADYRYTGSRLPWGLLVCRYVGCVGMCMQLVIVTDAGEGKLKTKRNL